MGAGVKTGPLSDKTPDGKDIVYVGTPSIETTEAWAQSQKHDREARRYEVTVGARTQALAMARELFGYRAFGTENDTTDEVAERVLGAAKKFESYLLGSEVV